jgi:hypothetical protein
MRQYNLPKMPLSHVIGSILLLGLTPQLSAKGLDQLKPGSSDNAEEEKSDSNAEQTPTTTQNETIEPQEKKVDVEKKVEPSALSMKLADRLHLGTGILWTSVSADEANWHAGFSSTLHVAWRMHKLLNDRLALFFTGQYQAVDTVTKLDTNQYRGVIQTISVGPKGAYDMSSYNINFSLLAGYSFTNLEPIENSKSSSKLEKKGFDTSLSVGASWKVRPKLELGPMIQLGFGTFSTIRGGVNASFVF